MKYSKQDTQFTGSQLTGGHSTEKRSVAETLLETINETLGQGGLHPGLAKQTAGRRGRRRQLAGALAMLAGLAALGFVFLQPASDRLPAVGEPVAFLELARGRAEMSGGGRGAASMLMLSGGEAIHAGAVIETGTAIPAADSTGRPAAGRAAVRLAGGQSMRLDHGSRVRFATSSSVVLERGAVYVDSAGGDNVEVRTALGVVRDIGTRFEVRLLSRHPGGAPSHRADATGAGSLRIRVRDGSVELEQDEKTHLVVAGEELRANAGGTVERGASSTCGAHWAWVVETAPVPNVAGRPLQEFLDWASEEACWTVRFVDQATADVAARTILHGDVEDLTLTEAASMVLSGSGLDYRLKDGVFVVGTVPSRSDPVAEKG